MKGSLATPVPTPNIFSEEQFAAALEEKAIVYSSGIKRVLLSHQPPVNTAVDRTASGRHVGSGAVRAYIEETSPALCISGHIHESYGKDFLGSTLLVNPGPFCDGKFAIIDLIENLVRVEFKAL